MDTAVDPHSRIYFGVSLRFLFKENDAPADTSPAMSEKNNPNKAGNISATDEVDTLHVANFVARPEGFEPPTLRSEVILSSF